ncbi:response regulator [Cohnella xylanilytica]|uniref:Response regulator n=1 Tax=Cohnella xylanilytica TaxID=557555 RepID=A0A841U5G1_9BACL|nr:response regulator [Cohnella xylanilytica]MBB6694842.1 response regulator [Cohnella xylanilytica]
MKIVLVDDEKGIVDGLAKMIGRYLPECQVVGAAYNGAEGFRSVQQRRPDIVITDIRMPKEDGLDMIKRLKEAGNQTKFILLSGYADFEYARRGMQLGVQFYINKPVEEEELRDCVHRVMEAIREDRVKRQEVDELKQEVRSRIQEEAIRNIIELGNEQTSDLAEELIRSAGIPTKDTRFASVLIELDGSVESLKETGLQPLYRLMDEALCRYKQVYRFHYSGTQIAAVVAHHGPIRCEELISSIHRLKEAAYREFKLSMTVGIEHGAQSGDGHRPILRGSSDGVMLQGHQGNGRRHSLLRYPFGREASPGSRIADRRPAERSRRVERSGMRPGHSRDLSAIGDGAGHEPGRASAAMLNDPSVERANPEL